MTRRFVAAISTLALSTSLTVAATGSAGAGGKPTSTTRSLEFPVRLSSSGTSLTELPGGVTYGWNDLRGPTRWGSRAANLRFQGSVDYVDGNGPFGGFVTVTRADGTKLALSVVGYATAPSGAKPTKTRFRGSVTVIGGSGPYAKARGTGTVSGFRKATLGSPVKLTFAVTVDRQ